MNRSTICPALSVALEQLKQIISANEADGKRTVVFCEDRLTLAAERTVCAAVGGTFRVSVYTFARFLSSERGKRTDVLSSQGSAMAIRRIIEENKRDLALFGKFSAAAAAGAVYDTIALLYSSRISAEDIARASAEGLLESKLRDIALIYSKYNAYLAESGKIDRNAYLGELPDVIRASRKISESEVVFLGFQSFTRSALECVRAVLETAKSVHGLFIGGAEEIYVNEASAAFEGAAKPYGGVTVDCASGSLLPEAEALRRSLFDAESFYTKTPLCCDNVRLFEAADEQEELEFIAASIKKFVLDGGERYAKISVMLPDVAGAERDVQRVFSQYRIPYYADRRHALSEHPVCAFLLAYLNCAASNCTPKDCDAVISSVMFPESREDKDVYRNYALRLADFRGGVKREPKPEILETMRFDYEAVQRVRKRFLRGLSFLPARGATSAVCEGLRRLLVDFNAENRLKELAETYRDAYPTAAAFSGKVYEATLGVLAEAESITGGASMPLKEFIKILKSGFGAMEISLLPPKADAVFVGDLATTANTGSDVVFAARLTGDVPGTSADTALLTDREIAALERVNLDVSPKIRQVNLRRRELTALNLCAFRKRLYLSYPVRLAGEESGASEILSYATAALRTRTGGELKPVELKKVEKSRRSVPYYCSEKIPALKRLNADADAETVSAVYGVLCANGFAAEAEAALQKPAEKSVSDGKTLFVNFNSVSPTALETYFCCPYRNFIQQGLKLQEREEGAMRPLDTGNFIHRVLQLLSHELDALKDETAVRARAKELAENLLASPSYAALTDSASGKYAAEELTKEAVAVCAGMYEQIANSGFRVYRDECTCEIPLDGGIRLFGRIDRIDVCGDMVRIIDYKTGTVDASAKKYYMGQKLQLPLYLLAASGGKRAVGAYYFPASVEYSEETDGVFRLQGFMDGSEDVVSASDTTLVPDKKSAYVDAYLGGKNGRLEKTMEPDVFADFLRYASLVARRGTREMLEGNIQPSPSENACKYCKAGGSCGFAVGLDGEERDFRSIKCREIADIVRRERGDGSCR